MGFYLRKAFKTGPVRLNLSKSGFGLSAGITGARLGMDSRGRTYVHGGRHGLYYRKYSKSGSAKKARSSRSAPGETVNLFHDTGVTYPSAVRVGGSSKMPAAPKATAWKWPLTMAGITVLILFFWLIAAPGWFAGLAFGAGGIGCGWLLIRQRSIKQKADNLLTSARRSASNPQSDVIRFDESLLGELPADLRLRTEWLLCMLTLEEAIGNESIDLPRQVEENRRQLQLTEHQMESIGDALIQELLADLLDDHLLSDEEERAVQQVLDAAPLSDTVRKRIEHAVASYAGLREEMEKPLEEIESPVPLVRGETAFGRFGSARLLNERVMKRFQRNNVQHRVLGYEIDLEGELLLTDRRMILTGHGSREYRLNRVHNVIADPEAGLVELVLAGRKSPVLITVPQPMLLAARLEKITEQHVQ